MFKHTVAIAMTTFFLSGCASTYYSNHKPSEFTRVPNPNFFKIKQTVISQRKADSWGDVDSTQGLLPGVYVSILENHDGTLFFGSGRSYFIKYSNKDAYYLRVGGYWLPKTRGAAPKLFYIVDSSKILIVKSIKEAEKRNLTASVSQVQGISHLNPPTTITEGVAYGLTEALSISFLTSEDGHIVLVPTEAGFLTKLSAELQPARAPIVGK